MVAKLSDVAKGAGVSIVTASKAMNGNPSVRPLLRQRVEESARKLNYTPNLLAKGLSRKSLNLISVYARGLKNPYFGLLTERIIDKLSQAGMHTLLCHSLEEGLTLRRTLSSCGSIMIDHYDVELIRRIAGNQLLVGVNCQFPADIRAANVIYDFSAAYAELAEAAISAKRRKVAFLLGAAEEIHDFKCSHVVNCLTRFGLNPVTPAGGGAFASIEALHAFLSLNPKAIDVVFCRNDTYAARLYPILTRLGYRVPQDIILVGCDNTLPMEGVWTVEIDFERVADTVVETFKTIHAGGQADKEIIVKTRAIIRN